MALANGGALSIAEPTSPVRRIADLMRQLFPDCPSATIPIYNSVAEALECPSP
ncbi:hypothetical protein GT755_37680 [Herbidospora sp. NEAU-GS84]|uniref:Uncharacterized protein n=1 Tax=Herbidospora solisilvae TaxID=2696284 RepID=A0A7C9J8F0_9ACTN|nr:hypothetical protein [Herbidospora solisilvae]